RIADAAERARRAEIGLRGAEYLRLSRTQEAISAGAERASAGSPRLAALTRRSQDVRQELDALYVALLRRLDDTPADADTAALRRRVALLEQERNALHQRLRTEHPAFWQLAYPRSARVADLARALAPDEVFIGIQPVAKVTLVWAVTPQGRIEMAASPVGADEVAAIVKSLRRPMDASIVTLEGLAPFDVDAAYRLYETLLAPLADVWHPATQLVVSAGGALGHLPFALLVAAPDPLPLSAKASSTTPEPTLRYAQYRNVAWLARTHAVTHVPSGAALISLRAVKSPAAGRAFFGVGDPQFGTAPSARAATRALRRAGVTRSAAAADPDPLVAPALPALLRTYANLPALPETRDEIIAIGAALGADLGRDAFFGAAATRAQVRAADLADRRVVAFATHGLLPGDLPLLEEPALALSAGAANDSPLLTLTDILTLQLNADWVVLSACNTASADGRGGDAISGLGRGFFYAGARALLVTHWEVETESARDLVSGTFMRYAHTTVARAQALRAAQLALIERGQDRSGRVSYAHPLFWAGYAVVGDGGR
ncbi:MAG TPA: CHAT domain-containing protein, partial [Burkholderiaceae bacterium]|nr:CHAT domain-containing protein [Burkholderiaceae bacterium]